MTEKQVRSVIHGAIAQIDFGTTSSEDAAEAVLAALKAAGLTFDPEPQRIRARKPTRRY
jgi:hypothetical protein